METVIIAGGTGMIGTCLSHFLHQKGFKVIILSRSRSGPSKTAGIEFAQWNVKEKKLSPDIIAEADYVINLSGANVMDKSWTPAYKREMLESRTESSRLIASMIEKIPNRIKAFINGSAIGWYGENSPGGPAFTETDPPAQDFLGETCRLWENSIPNSIGSVRICKIRTGIVLAPKGGFLQTLKLPVKLGIAPVIGKGTQIISWIHIDDFCGLLFFLMTSAGLSGSFNAVAPEPASNETITILFAKKMKGRFFLPVHAPTMLLKLALGDRSIEILKSCRVSCEKIKKAGYTFRFPDIDSALEDLTKSL